MLKVGELELLDVIYSAGIVYLRSYLSADTATNVLIEADTATP